MVNRRDSSFSSPQITTSKRRIYPSENVTKIREERPYNYILAGRSKELDMFQNISWFPFPWGPWASLVAQMVKNLCTMQETTVQSLGQEDPLGNIMATNSSILA